MRNDESYDDVRQLLQATLIKGVRLKDLPVLLQDAITAIDGDEVRRRALAEIGQLLGLPAHATAQQTVEGVRRLREKDEVC